MYLTQFIDSSVRGSAYRSLVVFGAVASKTWICQTIASALVCTSLRKEQNRKSKRLLLLPLRVLGMAAVVQFSRSCRSRSSTLRDKSVEDNFAKLSSQREDQIAQVTHAVCQR